MRPLKIIRSEEALRDLADIHLLIALDNAAAAERFLVAAQASLRTLALWPGIGPRYLSNRKELSGLRFWPVRRFANYLIFYRASGAPRRLHVVRILHGARDISKILE